MAHNRTATGAVSWRCGAAAALALLLCTGCGGKRAPATAPVPAAAPALIVLLPDPETQVTGRIHVSNEFGAVDLSTARASVRTGPGAPPGAPTTLSEEEVKRLFGAALGALPPAPRHFTLQFNFESDTLTDASTALVPQILAAVRALPVPEVMIVGHTDTMGDKKANLALGMKRAAAVREILVRAGLAPGVIDVTSHGEADLLIKTRDNTPEPRNRRVDITVR